MNKLLNSNTKSRSRSCRMFISWNTLKTGRGSTNHVVRRHIFHSHTRRTRSQSAVEKGRAHGESKWKGRKEGRNEWRREGREKGGGEEERYKAILSGFSCDCWGENVQMSALTPASFSLLPLENRHSYPGTKSCVFPKASEGGKKISQIPLKPGESHLWQQSGE